MTIAEAIEYGIRWKNAIIDRGDTENSEAVQFLNTAIQALEQEPSCRKTRQVDLISRADLQELFNETTTSLMDKIEQKDIEHLVRACVMVTEMIQDAPSVVPICENCGADMRGDEE